jgi:metal-responsive CopG/Arc/MetJ family transcriptional regulator
MMVYDRVVRATVSIADDLYEQADQEATRRGLNRSEFYAEALAAHLKELRGDDITDDINTALAATDPDDDDLAAWVERGAGATLRRTR